MVCFKIVLLQQYTPVFAGIGDKHALTHSLTEECCRFAASAAYIVPFASRSYTRHDTATVIMLEACEIFELTCLHSLKFLVLLLLWKRV